MPLSATKTKACKVCGTEFQPFQSTQKVCSQKCAYQLAVSTREAKEAREAARELRERRRELKPISYFAAKAQQAFNEWIRERDFQRDCIIHGADCPNKNKGWHACHFQSVGSNAHKRFITWNVHKGCGTTNMGSHKYSRYERGVDAMYEESLRARIGDERVDWLKGPQPQKQYTRDQLLRIGRIFRKRARLYRKLRERGHAGVTDNGGYSDQRGRV